MPKISGRNIAKNNSPERNDRGMSPSKFNDYDSGL